MGMRALWGHSASRTRCLTCCLRRRGRTLHCIAVCAALSQVRCLSLPPLYMAQRPPDNGRQHPLAPAVRACPLGTQRRSRLTATPHRRRLPLRARHTRHHLPRPLRCTRGMVREALKNYELRIKSGKATYKYRTSRSSRSPRLSRLSRIPRSSIPSRIPRLSIQKSTKI